MEYKIAGIRKSRLIQVPSDWKDLTPNQFIVVAKVYVNDISETQFLKQFFGLS